MFWFDKKKLRFGKSKFWFTVERKVLAILEALGIISIIKGLSVGVPFGFQGVLDVYEKNTEAVKEIIGFVGVGFVVLIVLLLLVYINSLKYGEPEKPKKKKKRGKKK